MPKAELDSCRATSQRCRSLILYFRIEFPRCPGQAVPHFGLSLSQVKAGGTFLEGTRTFLLGMQQESHKPPAWPLQTAPAAIPAFIPLKSCLEV